jgi:hypothetical protein
MEADIVESMVFFGGKEEDHRHWFFRAFSSVVRQMPGYNSQRRGTARTSKLVNNFTVVYV